MLKRRIVPLWLVLLAAPGLLLAARPVAARRTHSASRYLFVWANSAQKGQPDFLAVLDSQLDSPTYGQVLATLAVHAPTHMAHHTEYQIPANGVLFANDYDSGLTFRFDLRRPRQPVLLGHFGAVGTYNHPHSYAPLANGRILATFQAQGAGNRAAGALMALDPQGRPLRISPAADPHVARFIRPYSLVVVPALHRVVTTSSDMYNANASQVVQVWRLPDLRLVKTVWLPAGPRGDEGFNSAEPRLLADGRTVLVSTFHCGLYEMQGLATPEPTARLIHDFGGRNCAVPAVAGHYWLQPVGDQAQIVTLDVAHPDRPTEVARLSLGQRNWPHWMALEPDGRRLVVTGFFGLRNRVVMIDLGRDGRLTVDAHFHNGAADEPGLRLAAPGGGDAVPHGAVFSRPPANAGD